MKNNNYCRFFCFAIFQIGLLSSLAYGFEPISIDKFFEQYPDERPVQPTIIYPNTKNEPTHRKINSKKESTEFIEQDMSTVAQKYPEVEVLLLDRILGRSHITKFVVGEEKSLNPLFDVTISECLERKTEFHSTIHAVKMMINGYADSKPTTKKTLLFNDIFYIEMPGFKAFEHPIYDIKPIKCLGNPESVKLDEPVEKISQEEVVDSVNQNKEQPQDKQQIEKPLNNQQQSVEDIINNSIPKEKSDAEFVPVPVPLPQ
jgi:hypothetical protein